MAVIPKALFVKAAYLQIQAYKYKRWLGIEAAEAQKAKLFEQMRRHTLKSNLRKFSKAHTNTKL